MDTRYLHNKPSSGVAGKWSGGEMMNRITNVAARSAQLMLVWCITTTSALAANLVDMKFSSLPGGSFEAQLLFDAPPPTPQGYTIEKPARIALDLPGVTSQLKEKKHTLGYENASSAVILESTGRTRMILNLVQPAPYTTRVEGNTLFVEVGDSGAREYLKPVAGGSDAVSNALAKPSTSAAPVGRSISNVDFRRGDVGEGRLIVDLSDPKTEINASVEGQRIKLEFKGAALPENLRRRFDVVDFATPVKMVDAQSTSAGTVVYLQVTGEYDYLAYQTDNQYVVSVKPLTKDELETRKKEFAYTGQRLSLNFQDIEVRAVLQIIADFTGLNLVASDTVTGRITLRLQNVPWDQALALVLKTKGLDKRQEGNVLMVAPSAEIAERERQEIEATRQVQELAPLQTEYIRVRYARAKDFFTLFSPTGTGGGGKGEGAPKGTGNSILSERGSVIVDDRTNSLLVTETAQKLEEFRRIVKLLDVPIRQVLIEARLVIANSDFSNSIGVKWGTAGIVTGNNRNYYFGGTQSGVNSAINTNATNSAGGKTDQPVAIPDVLNVNMGATSPTSSFAVGYVSNIVQLDLELSAQESQGRGEVVSQPKVITGDKQQATIKSGTEIPYQQSAANGETTISFKEAVLKLDVTPSITPDDRIIMDLVINQDSVGKNVSTGNGGSVPSIDTNAIKTQVLVGNGETVVLGGVFKSSDVVTTSKVPFLGDLPYVGRLFSSKDTIKTKSELLIFITPRILADTLID
ncbi:MAG: fimbrial protein [Verrucomicrobiaceae bacterium]|nr:fimbrial protein [Verrucomicrobiaceae bacterium]